MMKMVYSDFVFLATCAVVIQMPLLQLVDACNCRYYSGGCQISRKAPSGYACRCRYMGAWMCVGRNRNCRNQDNYYCQNPDYSYQACLEGRGDCGGYSCDCSYRPGGCAITEAAQGPLSACKCEYMGGWTCRGRVVSCRWSSDDECRNPTTSFQSCLQGGGDCDGY